MLPWDSDGCTYTGRRSDRVGRLGQKGALASSIVIAMLTSTFVCMQLSRHLISCSRTTGLRVGRRCRVRVVRCCMCNVCKRRSDHALISMTHTSHGVLTAAVGCCAGQIVVSKRLVFVVLLSHLESWPRKNRRSTCMQPLRVT